MSKLLAVAARELRERWLLFPGALLAGLAPFVFPAFGKSATLPKGKSVPVDLPPAEPGEYDFTCGMGMLNMLF